jgi:hypothetical protein
MKKSSDKLKMDDLEEQYIELAKEYRHYDETMFKAKQEEY